MDRNPDLHETLRLDVMSKKQRVVYVVWTLVGIAACLVAGLTGPDAFYEKEPFGELGNGVDLANKPWAHAWVFGDNKYSHHLGLYFTPNPKSGYLEDRRFVRDIHLDIVLSGVTYNGKVVNLVNTTVPRRVSCVRGDCEDVLVFWDEFVSYKRYSWVVSTADSSVGETDWIEDVDFFFRAETIEFAVWQIRMNYLCFGLSVIGLIFWQIACRRDALRARARNTFDADATSTSCCCPYRTPTQKWILALGIAVALYNQPLLGFQYIRASTLRYVFIAASVVMQTAFLSILLVFWIEVFETMYRSTRPGMLSRALKICFALMFWITGCIVYGMTAYTANTNYVYDWTENDDLITAVRVTCIAFGVIYLCWALFFILRAASHIGQFGGRSLKLVLFGHVWRLLATCVGIFLGLVNEQDVRFTHVYYFFQFLFTLYVLEVMVLYQPVDYDLGLVKDPPVTSTETGRAAVIPVNTPHDDGATEVRLSEI
ncbi:G protein-coupled receptor 1 [Hondaea fermentalgiana]|uniref:G protein-coupled receptor 1 n=1 Tax=Hondaea fermentalgiana TaxID=2315210 RepID=A0A2R5GEY8_9STRA|nr:G protein-coupled receptor 1 [Hondaea fermentalgiana]|eukprot:GBG29502.1 G protein-coupled receptor 1 [Hondaea fermentalgiana]